MRAKKLAESRLNQGKKTKKARKLDIRKEASGSVITILFVFRLHDQQTRKTVALLSALLSGWVSPQTSPHDHTQLPCPGPV
jgi:hypothetical protein